MKINHNIQLKIVISILQLCCEIYFLQIEVQFQLLSYALMLRMIRK